MKDWHTDFRGKRVTMLGLGLLGRGVGDAKFLAEQGALLTITDKKTAEELSESVSQLSQYPNITFHLGGHLQEDFIDADMIIKAAGVPLNSPFIAAAKEASVPIYMSTALAAQFARAVGARIVGVTGTRGKSTVTQMIYHTLTHAGKRTHLGGNVRGVSTLALVPDIKQGDMLVLELDSWQLQGFGSIEMSPDVAVFNNLMPDHQNYYPDMDAYFFDKANIFRFQRDGDALIVGRSIVARIEAMQPLVVPTVPDTIPAGWHVQVPGEHNLENASLAAGALVALGLSEADIRDGLTSFPGVEGRLQYLGEIRDVQVYNDNNATTPEATIAALRALDQGAQNIVLIMGGADKGLALDGLVQEIHEHCKDVVLLSGTGTDRIRETFAHAPVYESLTEALAEGLRRAKTGEILLFSPAFASFGMFVNEYDRNDQFLALVDSHRT